MTMEAINEEALDGVLEELEQLLDQETAALRKLNHQEIEQLTARKVMLLGRASQANRGGVNSTTLARLSRIREVALSNQILMVHARDLVRGVLQTWAPGRVGASGTLFETRG